MAMADGTPTDQIVTLKVNGKPYACKGGTSKAKCKSKDFVLDTTVQNGRAHKCVVCGWLLRDAPGCEVEVLLPPRNDWGTPGGSVFAPEPGGLWTTLHEQYGFNADLAASDANRKTVLHFSEDFSALTRDWTLDELLNAAIYASESAAVMIDKAIADVSAHGVRAFANPPYAPRGTIDTWLRKAIEQCERGVWSGWLIPMSSSVSWFGEFVVPFGQWDTFEGRIAFIDPLATADAERTSPKQDNLFVVFDPDATFSGHVAHRSAKTGEYLWRR